MSGTDDLKSLTDCGCCETLDIGYPPHFNRPGLDALAYRLATHSGFFERMLARLTRDQLPGDSKVQDFRPLAKLSTRDTTDPTIALLDAWAVVADVLAFYQERIANEGFLRTAGERRSVLELARTIGYELKPGVAAGTVLAFTADGSKDSPPQVTVPKRTRVLSIPAKDQLPQTFETTEEIVARPEWNALKPYTPELIDTDSITRDVAELRLAGNATGLRAGDAILIVGDERGAPGAKGDEHWDFRILESVEPVPSSGFTRVRFTPGLGDQWPTDIGPAQRNPRLYAMRLRAALFGHNAPEWDTLDPAIKLRHAPRAMDAITSAAFSDDGKRILCSCVDGTLRLWNRQSGDLIAAWVAHAGSVNAAVFTPDSRYIVSCGDDALVKVWDAATGSEVHSFTGHQGPVLDIDCGQYQYEVTVEDVTVTLTKIIAVSSGADTTLRGWDLEKFVPLPGSAALASAANSVALYCAGKGASLARRVVCGCADGSVWLWNAAAAADGLFSSAGAKFAVAHSGAVYSVDLAASGARIVSGGADSKIKTWELGGAWLSHGEIVVGNGKDAVLAVTFSADAGQILAGTADGRVELWPWQSGSVTRPSTAHTGPVTAVAWAAGGDAPVLTGGADRKLYSRTGVVLKIHQTLASTQTEDYGEWPDYGLKVNRLKPSIDLDSAYPVIVPGSWVVLARTGYVETYRVTAADVRWVNAFSLSYKVTRLVLDWFEHLTWFGRRNTTVYAQSEPLAFYSGRQPDRSPLHGRYLELSTIVQGLEAGRKVVVAGQRMRVRVRYACRAVLTSADGYSTADLADGDVLVCLSPPYPDRLGYVVSEWRPDEDGLVAVVTAPKSESVPPATITLRWFLRDRNGFEGYVSTTSEQVADRVYEDTQMLVLRPPDKEADKTSEVATIELVEEVDRRRSRLWFSADLANLFDYEFLTLNANVAAATHGETMTDEVLGSGDGTLSNQRFSLRRAPLTYVSAPTASGGESTLEVRVNNVLWREVPSLHELGARDQSYLVRHDDQHNATIVFGDGVRGTRLPTGQENIQATYRHGIGLDGEVAAGAIKLLVTKPLGIREVINPVAATGAAAPESLDQARSHAPVTVLTLDRVVSLRDYEDFAAAFSGVGKAQASALWTGTVQMVHITVATASGKPVERGSAVHDNLVAALARLRDQSVPVQVQGFALLHFKLTAQLRIDPRYRRDHVEQSTRDALSAVFSFEQRAFGQAVTHAEVTTVIQSVPGVLAVTLTQFGFFHEAAPSGGAKPLAAADAGTNEPELIPAVLPASRATWQAQPPTALPAQLLLLYPTRDGVKLEEMPQ